MVGFVTTESQVTTGTDHLNCQRYCCYMKLRDPEGYQSVKRRICVVQLQTSYYKVSSSCLLSAQEKNKKRIII